MTAKDEFLLVIGRKNERFVQSNNLSSLCDTLTATFSFVKMNTKNLSRLQFLDWIGNRCQI